jgi:hypothetical protein
MRINSCEYFNNIAFRASLFYSLNSQRDILIESGAIHENGFFYHPTLNPEMFLDIMNSKSMNFEKSMKAIKDAFSTDYINFLKLRLKDPHY